LHFFPEDMHSQVFMDLSLNLKAIIAQQLVARADGKGRYPVMEILLGTPLVRDLIRPAEKSVCAPNLIIKRTSFLESAALIASS
jgi:Tfp pilus assembly ATPase PilU